MSPCDVSIDKHVDSLYNLMNLMEQHLLTYEAQNLSNEVLSKIIENIFLRLPYPSYFCIQKKHGILYFPFQAELLEAVHKFVVKRSFSLCGLEYFTELNGVNYNEISPMYQRSIKEYTLDTYRISEYSEAGVMQNIIERYRRIYNG